MHSLKKIARIYSVWGRHPVLYAAQDWITFLGRHHLIRREAVAAMGLGKGARVLEVACGTGRNFPYIMERIGKTGELVGFDYSSEMLNAAERLCKHNHWSHVQLIQGDAAQLKIDRNNFDGILCVLGMSAIPDYKKTLQRCFDLLKPGGVLSVCDAKPFPGKLRLLNPLIESIYTASAAWHPKRQIAPPMKRLFGNIKRTEFNFGSFYVATSKKE